MLGVYVALVGLALTIAGLIVKVTSAMTEMRVWVDEMREERHAMRKAIRRIPMIEFRLSTVEKHLDISAPQFPNEARDAE